MAIAEALVAAGIRDFEVTSFVRPDRVPAMADAEAMCAATQHLDVTRWGLVLNRRGAERALAAGIDHLQYVISVSDTHSRHNAGASTADALVAFEELAAGLADEHAGATIELTLATSFGCPYEGPIDQDAVVEVARRAALQRARHRSGSPTRSASPCRPRWPRSSSASSASTGIPIGAHLHDTRGLALANALMAIEHGATRLDAAVGGLGGCPFAPGASGNLPIEDLVHALEGMGVDTGCSVDGLIDCGADRV